MPKLSIAQGTTSKLLNFLVYDTSSVTIAGLAGLVFNTSSLTARYYREGASVSTLVTLATMTVGTWSTSGFVAVDGVNMPGLYQFGVPNAALATGAKSVYLMLSGAANMAPVTFEIELTSTDNQDSVRGGMTALPNAAAAANGGLPTVDATNSVKIQSPIKKNTALAGFPFQMVDATGNPVTGLTVTSEVSIDAAGFVSTANTATEIAHGWYRINLATTDMNGTVIKLRFSAGGAADTDMTLFTQP
jgi:hypothetical protein